MAFKLPLSKPRKREQSDEEKKWRALSEKAINNLELYTKSFHRMPPSKRIETMRWASRQAATLTLAWRKIDEIMDAERFKKAQQELYAEPYEEA